MNTNCCIKNSCPFFAAVASIVVGIAVALLRFTAVITITPVILWVLFGIAAAYLFITPFLTAHIRSNGCACSLITVVLTGIIGTVLTALILLITTFAATSVTGAIITGALAAFFTLLLTATACLAKCFCYSD